MRLVRCAALLLLLMAASAQAASTPPGVNIRWDNCFDDGGLANKTFACNVNTGFEELELTFVLADAMADVSGQEIIVEVRSANPTLPAWWQMKNPGTCRQPALNFLSGFIGSEVNCTEWSAGEAIGGIGAYTTGLSGANSARVSIAVAVPQAALAVLDPGVEYISGRLRITHTKTVGTGACTGCAEPVCLFFAQINITTPAVENNIRITSGANGEASQIATWQDGSIKDLAPNCGRTGCFPTFSCAAPQPTGMRSSTWGAVKSLYR